MDTEYISHVFSGSRFLSEHAWIVNFCFLISVVSGDGWTQVSRASDVLSDDQTGKMASTRRVEMAFSEDDTFLLCKSSHPFHIIV
jgi:hypothetical protein